MKPKKSKRGGAGWTIAECGKCHLRFRLFRKREHEESAECRVTSRRRVLYEAGYDTVGEFHRLLRGVPGLVREEETQLFVDGSAGLQGWVPRWALQIARIKRPTGKTLYPAKLRRKMLLIAQQSETSRHLILADPQSALQMIKDME